MPANRACSTTGPPRGGDYLADRRAPRAISSKCDRSCGLPGRSRRYRRPARQRRSDRAGRPAPRPAAAPKTPKSRSSSSTRRIRRMPPARRHGPAPTRSSSPTKSIFFHPNPTQTRAIKTRLARTWSGRPRDDDGPADWGKAWWPGQSRPDARCDSVRAIQRRLPSQP